MSPRTCTAILLLAGSLACGGDPEVATRPPDASPVSLAGTYRVEGVTTVIGREELTREISGTVVMTQEGGDWAASFELETLYPGPDGPLPAQVVGTGQGTISGRELKGSAKTQIVASRIPGIDSQFILVPPSFGVRIVSTSVGTVNEDGSISLEIENRGAEGEDYIPTRTTVRGVRRAD